MLPQVATLPEERVYRLPGGVEIAYDRLTEAERAEADVELAEFAALVRRNPLMGFEWHSEAQRVFLAARTRVVAAIAGNRFGKTTSLIVRALIDLLPAEALPPHLRAFKRFHGRIDGWIVCGTEAKIFDTMKPALEQWVGAEFFRGGNWGKAFNGERMQLTFADGSTVTFKTYEQHSSTLTSASLWFVGYDEPPPKDHREECRTRLVDHGGYEMFAMTPIKTNTGYIKKAIFKQREAPHITLVRGSIHDNSAIPEANKLAWFADMESNQDLHMRARMYGEFVNAGGQIYELFERRVIERPAAGSIRGLDVVVGIDPGVRNCGIVFGAFDAENVGTIFDELLLQDATVADYAREIRRKLDTWMIPLSGVQFVIDPASRSRSQINAESVQSALAVEGIYCTDGQNAVEAGIQQVRGRLQAERLWVGRNCVLLRDEADEYEAEDRDDGEFKPVKQNDHLMDAMRYLCMARPWYPSLEAAAPQRNLGFVANHSFDLSGAAASEAHPFGAMI